MEKLPPQWKTTWKTTRKPINSKDEQINSKDEKINSKDEQIDSKDEQINSKDGEIWHRWQCFRGVEGSHLWRFRGVGLDDDQWGSSKWAEFSRSARLVVLDTGWKTITTQLYCGIIS